MQLQAFLDALFAKAKQAGLAQCEAYISSGDSFEASVNAGEIIDYSSSSSFGLSFRALVNGKMGYASTQALDESALGMLIDGAMSNAALIESADEQFIYPGSRDYPAMNRHNGALDALAPDWKIERVKELERLTLGYDPRMAQTEQCAIASGNAMVRIVNSMGLDVSHRDNLLMAFSVPVARDGEQVNTGVGFQVVRDEAALDLQAIAKEAAEDALAGLSAAPVASGLYHVALKNAAMTDLLSVFSGVFSADNAQKGLSLLAGREGERIASEAVTLMDDPFHAMGFSGAPFDAEGVPSRAKAVIEEGQLTTLLHNLKTAKKQGLTESTGNASKAGYASPIGVAPSNFYLAPGELSFDALLARLGDGLLITELQGLHAGANPISGDFSLSAKGFVVSGGQVGSAVSQITVSGNFYQLLKDTEAVGSDLRFAFPGAAHIGSPTVLVKGLAVAGV